MQEKENSKGTEKGEKWKRRVENCFACSKNSIAILARQEKGEERKRERNQKGNREKERKGTRDERCSLPVL